MYLFIFGGGGTDDEIPFTYIEGTGKGPKKWGEIDPRWKACGNGKMQSPIDLLDREVPAFPSLGKLKRDYKPAPAVVKNRGHDITVINPFPYSHLQINSFNVCNFKHLSA